MTAPTWLLIACAVAYVLVPGAPDTLLNGIPIGQTGIVTLVVVIGTWLWTRRQAPAVKAWTIAALAAAIVVKVAIASFTPEAGWLASYYANESFTPPVERSIDFPGLPATRIDRDLLLKETEFPVHFFNNREYNTGVYREWSLPFSVHWTGYTTVDRQETHSAAIAANGRAEVLLDGRRQALIEGGLNQTAVGDFTLKLEPGAHRVEIRYQKPANTAPLIALEQAPGKGAPFMDDMIAPFETARSAMARRPIGIVAGWLLHAIVLAVLIIALMPGVRRRGLTPLPIAPLVVALLLAQGLWKSQHLVGHVWTMSGGDDWLNYEMTGRDGVLNGLLMSQGGVIGRGQPFGLYPGYAYFIAFVHWLTGESLAGVVLMNFVMLAAATLVAYRIGWYLFGPAGALGGLVWLLLLEQADFVRYYTVTLFSENLYFVLAAVTVLYLLKHLQSGSMRDVAIAAVAGALASWTRPSMMLLLPFAIAAIVVARWRADGIRRSLVATVVFASVWMLWLMPITIRNYIMSERAVLLTIGQGASFVAYNMPVDDPKYFAGYDRSLFGAAGILVWMFFDHPLLSLQNYAIKLGFSLGMVHWMGAGTVHPELIATSVLYFAGFVFLKPMRSIAALPMHLFIFTHVATLMLTMPSNYGYRMILPAFVFMSLTAGALLFAPVIRAIAARSSGANRLLFGDAT